MAAPIRPVHKSPSLTVAESRLLTVVSAVRLTVPITMCFQRHLELVGLGPVGWTDRLVVRVDSPAGSTRRMGDRNPP